MTINLNIPNLSELKPRITVFGVGGAGGNAVNHMINRNVQGVEFIALNTDKQALRRSLAEHTIQLGEVGLGAGARPEAGRAAADAMRDHIRQRFEGARSMLRGMTNYLVDNASSPIALADMRSAWAGVMSAPVKQEDGALLTNEPTAPDSGGARFRAADTLSSAANNVTINKVVAPTRAPSSGGSTPRCRPR